MGSVSWEKYVPTKDVFQFYETFYQMRLSGSCIDIIPDNQSNTSSETGIKIAVKIMGVPQKQKIIINLSERFLQDFWPLFLRLYVCLSLSGKSWFPVCS